MRRSVALVAAVGVVVAAAAATFGLWLPARHRRADAAWSAAGERALSRVALPSSYVTTPGHARIEVCTNGPMERCFSGPGSPTAQVATMQAALADLATGPVHASCAPVPLPGSPPSCHLTVPVSGSRLAVELFARPRDTSKPLDERHYTGAYALIHLDPR